MEWIPAAMTVGSTLLKVRGSQKAASAARDNAKLTEQEKQYEAAQLLQKANQSIAESQRRAAEERRRATIVQSRTLAVAAASGAGVSDPSLVNLLARVAGEGTYRAATAVYGGEEQARLLRMQAEGVGYEGAAALRGGALKADALETQAAGDLIAGAGSLFAKYNAGRLFKTTPTGSGGPTSAGDIPVFS